MFPNWGFLLGEIWVLLLLAALLGLLAGRIIWRRRSNTVQLTNLQAQLDECRADLKSCRLDLNATPATATQSTENYDGDGVVEGTNEGTRPDALKGPRDGVSDDLKQIKGVGLKMEKLCNSLGFYHFDQIASWNKSEIAWVDANLEGFKGRVTRDAWVKQAKVLAKGGTTTFSKKVAKGAVDY